MKGIQNPRNKGEGARGYRLISRFEDEELKLGGLAAREEVIYLCAVGHETIVYFADTAEAYPTNRRCASCGRDSRPNNKQDITAALNSPRTEHTWKTHGSILRERRTEEELQTLLDERVQLLRSQGGPNVAKHAEPRQ